jgi:Transposase domain (DUF772)
MLKIYVYGYLNRVRSSQRLERECQRNVELTWLTGRLAPDFKTIADFRPDHGPAIRNVCRRFVELCRGLMLTSPRYQTVLSAEIPPVALPDDAGRVWVIAGDNGGDSPDRRRLQWGPLREDDSSRCVARRMSLPKSLVGNRTTGLECETGVRLLYAS